MKHEARQLDTVPCAPCHDMLTQFFSESHVIGRHVFTTER